MGEYRTDSKETFTLKMLRSNVYKNEEKNLIEIKILARCCVSAEICVKSVHSALVFLSLKLKETLKNVVINFISECKNAP
jgi:hypothetical protein